MSAFLVSVSVFVLFGIFVNSDSDSDNLWISEELSVPWDSIDYSSEWNKWKVYFHENYDTFDEDSSRFNTWITNWKYIVDFNLDMTQSVKLRMNQFGDLNKTEFQFAVHGHNGKCIKTKSESNKYYYNAKDNNSTADSPVDWTNVNGKSYVTPIKNQGSCGSCWAFAATGCMESRGAIMNGKTGNEITTLSEQQLVDCSGSYGNNGCGGGEVDNAFKYVQHEGGLCSESEYRYTAKNGQCKAPSCGTKYDAISSYVDVKPESTQSLEDALQTGPVSVGVEADEAIFQFYSSGVMQPGCDAQIDHGVLIVGYGTDTGGSEYYKDYWKMKNSWGTTWGMKGYALLCRNCNANAGKGECGLLQQPSYAVMKS